MEGESEGQAGPIGQLRAYFDTVAAEKNVGEHVASVFKDKAKMAAAIGELVETNPTAQLSRAFLTMTPNDTMDEFWLPLRSFDYSDAVPICLADEAASAL